MSLAGERDVPFWISLAVALGIHAAAATLFVLSSSAPGAGERQTAAVSLNLIETLIVQAAEIDSSKETVSEDAEVSSDAGTIEGSAPSPAEMETEKDEQTEKAEAAGKDRAKPEDVKPRQERKRKSQPSKVAKKGGAKARGKSSKKNREARFLRVVARSTITQLACAPESRATDPVAFAIGEWLSCRSAYRDRADCVMPALPAPAATARSIARRCQPSADRHLFPRRRAARAYVS